MKWFHRIVDLTLKIGGTLGAFSVVTMAMLWAYQEKILFQPKCTFPTPDKNPRPYQSPDQQGMEYEDKYIQTKDGIFVHAWMISQRGSAKYTAPTMIYFQGNAGNMGLRLPVLYQMYSVLGVNILAVSYRGYGWSGGEPTERGVYLDAEAALDWLMSESFVCKDKVFVYGQSVGGAVAIYLGWKRAKEIKLIVVENTFTCVRDMVLILFPLLKPFSPILQIFQRIQMNSLDRISSISSPLLVLTGSKDTLVPPSHSHALYTSSISTNKHNHVVVGGGHNDLPTVGGRKFYEVIKKFVNENFESKVTPITTTREVDVLEEDKMVCDVVERKGLVDNNNNNNNNNNNIDNNNNNNYVGKAIEVTL